MSKKKPIISLLTDFGTKDYFVGTMKGVILSVCTNASIVDITNEVSPFNIMEAAFILKNSYQYFPKGTIHLIVVDPGVGSERRILIAKSSKYTFVAPDNGVLSCIFRKEREIKVYSLINEKILPHNDISRTFHGRDIMAPLAAKLANGKLPSKFGKVISDYKTIKTPEPSQDNDNMTGEIIYSDSFGNLITNISRKDFECFIEKQHSKKIKVRCGRNECTDIVSSYSEGSSNKINCIWASHGNLELFVREGNASKKLKIKSGDKVKINIYQK